MYYCCSKDFQKEILKQDNQSQYVYYDEETNQFLDYNNKPVDIENKTILPFSDIFRIDDLLDQIEEFGGIPVNDFRDIDHIKHWFQFMKVNRNISMVTGKDFESISFLFLLFKTYHITDSIFLKTVEKDFHGIIPITEIVDPESNFRKAMKKHSYDEFIIESVISIDEDELGKEEYRAFIHDRKITSISRPLRHTYHKIPEEAVTFINKILETLPDEFPNYFVIDILRTNGEFEILECNPIETSAPYLYNSRQKIENDDLTHKNITNLPMEHQQNNCTFSSGEQSTSPIFYDVYGSFAKDYEEIKSANSLSESNKVKVKQ